jgi:hypothetical protein
MTTGNAMPAGSDGLRGARVRDDSQLRDIEDLVARLQLVTRQLSLRQLPPQARIAPDAGDAAGDAGRLPGPPGPRDAAGPAAAAPAVT